MAERFATPLLFEDLFSKPSTITFDEPHTSSDGGAILLHAMEKKMGLANILADGGLFIILSSSFHSVLVR